MPKNENEDSRIYKVIINQEEQYSLWLSERANPLGWSDTGKSGLKQECLDYVREVWTDMRPLSIRNSMDNGRSWTTTQ